MNSNDDGPNWSATYWVLLANQLVAVAMLVFLASVMLAESYRAGEAAMFELPAMSLLFFKIGPTGLILSGAVSAAVSLAAMAFRRRFASIAVASISFLWWVSFVAVAIYSAFAPLCEEIHRRWPPGS